jgi:hypothetical protein
VLQIFRNSVDLDVPAPADYQHMIAFRFKGASSQMDAGHQGTGRIDDLLAGGLEPLPLPIADPVGRDQNGRRFGQGVLSFCLALDHEAPRFKLRLHDFVVYKLPVNRECTWLINCLDHFEGVPYPETHSHDIRSNHTHATSFSGRNLRRFSTRSPIQPEA